MVDLSRDGCGRYEVYCKCQLWQDSLAMLLRLMEENWPLDIVVFYDTGMEFDCIYKIRDKIRPVLKERGVEYVELKPKIPFLYSMLEKEVNSRQKGTHYGNGWCGGLCRWGTSEKLREIKQFKDSLAESVIDYVGIAFDEPKRFDKATREGKMLPLVQWQIDRRRLPKLLPRKEDSIGLKESQIAVWNTWICIQF